jgi:hypothetical protein
MSRIAQNLETKQLTELMGNKLKMWLDIFNNVGNYDGYFIRLKTQIQPEIWNWIRFQLERRIDLQGIMDTSCSSWDAKQAKSAKWLVDSPPIPMRSEIHVTHISNSLGGIPMTHVTNHGEAGGPCPQTASLLLPRHASPECEDRWSPKSIEDIVLHTMQQKIGKVRFIVIYFYELDCWWFLPTSKSFWGFTWFYHISQFGLIVSSRDRS